MMMFVIFLIVNVGTIGIFYGVYGTKRKYEEGMLMGVHLPGSAAESEEVKMLMKKYRTWTKWFYTLNLLAGIAVCGFCCGNAVLCILGGKLHEGALRRLRYEKVTAVHIDPHLLRYGFV